jgi:hypothetical protein
VAGGVFAAGVELPQPETKHANISASSAEYAGRGIGFPSIAVRERVIVFVLC